MPSPAALAERHRILAYIEDRARRLSGRVGPRVLRVVADDLRAGLHEKGEGR